MTKNNNNKRSKPSKNGNSRSSPGQRTVQVPSAAGTILQPSKFTMQSVGEGVVRFRGHEILGAVNTAAFSTLAGVFDVNPSCWQNSRLSRIASTYEKYRFDSFTIRYHPTVSTTASNAVATYVELEVEEPVTVSVVGALNHQYAAMSPAWAGHEVTYKRPPQDPTTYILTNKAVGDRSQLSQAKIVSIASADGPQTLGYLSIEYDVTFMYPEIEFGFAGRQFTSSSGTIPVLAPNANIVCAPNWDSNGMRVAEIVLDEVLQDTVNAAGATFNFGIGDVLYTAWDGVNWLLYQSLEAALSLVNPLRTAPGMPGTTLNYFVRVLTRE